MPDTSAEVLIGRTLDWTAILPLLSVFQLVRKMSFGRGRLRRWVGLVALAIGAAFLVALALLPGLDPDEVTKAAEPKPARAEVLVNPGTLAITVPRSFLGASTEYWALPLFARHLPLFDRALSLLRVAGDGPLKVRIGGDSADRSLWDPGRVAAPPWLFGLTQGWLRSVEALVRDLHVRLILDLNLAIDSPSAADALVRAAEAGLPAGSLAGLEVGNEPDLYPDRYLIGPVMPTDADTSIAPPSLSPRTYVRDFDSYARVLARAAPRVPLIAPALARPRRDVGWISTLLREARPRLGAVSAHLYRLSACAPPGSGRYPTVAKVLSESSSAGLARELGPALQLTHRAGLPFRLTELNSVTCGGVPGVSDSFATALWAPDALFELARSGVASADIHIRFDTPNAPFVVRDDQLVARPLLYGLALFARTLGPRAQLVKSELRAPSRLHLKVWAVRIAGDRLHVLIIDKGARGAVVDLRLPATAPASVERLLASSDRSRSGVTLEGQRVDYHAIWSGRRRTQTIFRHAGRYQLLVPRMSAAMVSVQLSRAPVTPSRRRAHRSRSRARR